MKSPLYVGLGGGRGASPAGLNLGGGILSFPGIVRSVPDCLARNSTAQAVMQLDMEFRNHISIEDTCFRYVSDSSSLYNVLNDDLLNALVLGHTLGTVCAAN